MRRLFLLLFLPSLAIQAQHKPAKPATVIVPAAETPPIARSYVINDRQTIVVNTKVRFDTWIILPANDSITEAGAGDPDNWSIKAADEKRPTNLVHVKPAEANARTNLHLRTASGRIYSFLLAEISGCATCQPDLKVFVDPPPENMTLTFPSPAEDHRKEITMLRQQVQAAREEAGQAKSAARTQVNRETAAFRAAYPVALRCDYRYKFGRAPFFVEAICSDGLFTYIKSAAEELPSLYMAKDGKPALVKFEFRAGKVPHEGTYIINSVMTHGYLQLGKKKLKFQTRS